MLPEDPLPPDYVRGRLSPSPFDLSPLLLIWGTARSGTGELSIPARLLTKGDRPVAPTRTCGWVPASHRVGENRLRPGGGGRAKDFSPLRLPSDICSPFTGATHASPLTTSGLSQHPRTSVAPLRRQRAAGRTSILASSVTYMRLLPPEKGGRGFDVPTHAGLGSAAGVTTGDLVRYGDFHDAQSRTPLTAMFAMGIMYKTVPKPVFPRHPPVQAGGKLCASRYPSPGFPAPAPDLIQGLRE